MRYTSVLIIKKFLFRYDSFNGWSIHSYKILIPKYNGIINCGSGNGISLKNLATKIALNKFSKKIEFDKRFKTKKPSKIICNNYKLLKITGIKKRDNLMKIIWKRKQLS